jgi:hypothetical protein
MSVRFEFSIDHKKKEQSSQDDDEELSMLQEKLRRKLMCVLKETCASRF